ncbi:GNAT family N-acetyltransferase [Pelagibacterium halotolerans]|uniref:Histone acetyltransferase HPA2-related acetyltransferase n=1 Tax=Pelagibacterium halotolerans (strain DSM 22347 / JCM 15775 / CGMCC 1.7692 / B2) TaxID=1082931 RepID=G4RFC5_PELHB|nr:GNAT family N-acetyltransferase [Pelagibacterium halotolerans]AEQ51963.1 histone acetyltransferase HPA2-related acetyltransferase [Pelagibacterium halotolerans B2]QJR18246.1 GNAT family N-acetyltransferase [Pelagibacterium halotolerans]SDZ80535.1 L-amino acid N-acyltransferase YncA [Pelagibacterium halotolerans]
MELCIRKAVAADANLIRGFVGKLAEYEKLSHEVEATAEQLGAQLFGESPKVFCEIAELGGEPVGFALWFYTFSTFQGRHGIWLEDLFVEPEARGKGIGKALLAALARRCVDEGLGRFEWWVLDWNEPSIEFYKSQGAVMQDEWTVCRVSGADLVALAGKP